MSIKNKPSQNDAAELQDLVNRIDEILNDYIHVAEYIPNGLHTALDKMYAHNFKYTKEIIKRK
jgi:hypothetical protein